MLYKKNCDSALSYALFENPRWNIAGRLLGVGTQSWKKISFFAKSNT